MGPGSQVLGLASSGSGRCAICPSSAVCDGWPARRARFGPDGPASLRRARWEVGRLSEAFESFRHPRRVPRDPSRLLSFIVVRRCFPHLPWSEANALGTTTRGKSAIHLGPWRVRCRWCGWGRLGNLPQSPLSLPASLPMKAPADGKCLLFV